MDFEVAGPYVVALLMSIGAVFIFVWGVLSGALSDTDRAALEFYRTEVGNDEAREHARQLGQGEPG